MQPDTPFHISMSRAQVQRWAEDHGCPRTGHIFEVPLKVLVPRVLGVIGLAGAIWWTIPHLLWNKKPLTLDPEFVAEAKRIGMVAVSPKGCMVTADAQYASRYSAFRVGIAT